MKLSVTFLLIQLAQVAQIAALPRGPHWEGTTWPDWSPASISLTAQASNTAQLINAGQSSSSSSTLSTSDEAQTTSTATSSSAIPVTTAAQSTTTGTSTSTSTSSSAQSTNTTEAETVPYKPGLTGPGGWTSYSSVRSNNTLNSTVAPASTSISTTGGQLQLTLTNNYNTNKALNVYVTGLDSNGRLVMLQPSGEFYYPESNSTVPILIDAVDVSIPLGSAGSSTTLTIPSWISAGRVWVAAGTLKFYSVQSGTLSWALVEPSIVSTTDPNADVDFGFIELTNDATLGLYVNISYVDFVGLALGISVTATSSTQTVSGLPQDAMAEICSDLQAQEAIDGYPWGDLCITDASTGDLIRVISPGNYISINSSAFSDYWTAYLDDVWEQYTSQSLIINSQSSPGNISCTASGDELVCTGSSRTYAKPAATDIFSCNTGPFEIATSDNDIHRAVVPRLCAAINRSTLLLTGGNIQPASLESEYYSVSPTNHYSRIVHAHSADGIGYAFSYDDVMPEGGINESGLLVVSDPTELAVTVQS